MAEPTEPHLTRDNTVNGVTDQIRGRFVAIEARLSRPEADLASGAVQSIGQLAETEGARAFAA